MSSVFDLATSLAQAQAGQPTAIADLYTAYGVLVHRYCAARLGSAEAAEDCTQEVFLRIWRAVRTFDYRGEVSFNAWLYTIANHVVVSYLRKNRRVALVSLTPELELADSRTSATAHTICEQVVLRDALAELTVEQQQVITLKFWGGLSNAEIAACLGRTEGAVKALQYRGVQRLQHLLGQAQRAERATA
jgi:RNA polymerase sigma-70 factor (ECF subfamily)